MADSARDQAADVIVVGAGGAGLRAAIECSRQGLSTGILSKSLLGKAHTVMAEGGAALVLEELEHAQARGARIYAELVGYGMSADAHHITLPKPGGMGAAQAMRRALEKSGLAPEDIQYINAHGTSTQANDVTDANVVLEAVALNELGQLFLG